MRGLVFLLLVAGCAAPAQPDRPEGRQPVPPPTEHVSVQCDEAWQVAEQAPSGAENEPIARTLVVCDDLGEWLAGLKRHKGAFGLKSDAEVGRIEVQVACWENEQTPVCVEAAAVGMLD